MELEQLNMKDEGEDDAEELDIKDEAEAEEAERELEEKEKEKELERGDDEIEEEVKVVDIDKWKEINKKFKKNECEYSLFILSQTNPIRIACVTIVHSKKFDNFILMLIVLSTLRLILDTFFETSPITTILFDSCDVFFNFFFYLEFVLKVLGEGFIWQDGTYLTDNWNKLDFLIVVVSMVDMQSIVNDFSGANSTGGISFFRVLRLLRTLRPLRFISHNVQLKLIVKSLMDSVEPILNVLAIVFIVFLMFGIMGMTLFYSGYHTCYQMSDIYGYYMAFPNFADLLKAENITGTNETENSLFVSYLI